jgi:hypothetical protein
MNYEPYNFDSFKELVKHAYMLGWYSGRKTLFNLKCEGEFEGFYGRASEAWNQQFTLTTEEVLLENGKKIPAISVKGETIKEACDKALKLLTT